MLKNYSQNFFEVVLVRLALIRKLRINIYFAAEYSSSFFYNVVNCKANISPPKFA